MRISIKKNLGLKLASLGFAVLLWVSVVVIGQTVIFVEVPVKYSKISEGLVAADPAGRTVTVTVKGHSRFLEGLGPEDISVELDMSELDIGQHSYKIKPDDVIHPAMLRVVRVRPALLNIQIEEQVERAVPVRVITTGTPMKGFAVRGVEVIPGLVMVTGARSVVSGLRSLPAGPVDISGADSDVFKEVFINTTQSVVLEQDRVMIKVLMGKE